MLPVKNPAEQSAGFFYFEGCRFPAEFFTAARTN
jgi:hypothetical protein